MNSQNVRLDSKGRIIIPNSFREVLGIKTGENIVIQLDKENERFILLPIEKKTKKVQVFIGDEPGVLSKVAVILAKNKVDLIYSESRSLRRMEEAVWDIVADFSKADLKQLQSDLNREKTVKRYKFGSLQLTQDLQLELLSGVCHNFC